MFCPRGVALLDAETLLALIHAAFAVVRHNERDPARAASQFVALLSERRAAITSEAELAANLHPHFDACFVEKGVGAAGAHLAIASAATCTDATQSIVPHLATRTCLFCVLYRVCLPSPRPPPAPRPPPRARIDLLLPRVLAATPASASRAAAAHNPSRSRSRSPLRLNITHAQCSGICAMCTGSITFESGSSRRFQRSRYRSSARANQHSKHVRSTYYLRALREAGLCALSTSARPNNAGRNLSRSLVLSRVRSFPIRHPLLLLLFLLCNPQGGQQAAVQDAPRRYLKDLPKEGKC